jgi:toxin-antitoxin system PIN domain toxin
MSFAFDTNILLYASNTESDVHDAAKEYLRRCLAGPQPFHLLWPVAMGYLRIATHPNIFRNPISPRQAKENINTLLHSPFCRRLSENDLFWEVYATLSQTYHPRGNLVPDTHIAALLLAHGVRTFHTRDRDFRRFDHLEVIDPFTLSPRKKAQRQ